jgi:hypothetical protein
MTTLGTRRRTPPQAIDSYTNSVGRIELGLYQVDPRLIRPGPWDAADTGYVSSNERIEEMTAICRRPAFDERGSSAIESAQSRCARSRTRNGVVG